MVRFEQKRGQIGETMTWIVATLVIVVILGISVFVAVPLGKLREFKFERTSDLLATKSLTNYLRSDGVYNMIQDTGELNEYYKQIIEGFYEEEYYNEEVQLYITSRKDSVVGGEAEEVKCQVDVRIWLNEKEDVLLCLGSE